MEISQIYLYPEEAFKSINNVGLSSYEAQHIQVERSSRGKKTKAKGIFGERGQIDASFLRSLSCSYRCSFFNNTNGGDFMIVKECMTKAVELGTPEMTLHEAAKKMRDGDFGVLPIQKNDRLVGMLTDRDIAIRCVAEGGDYRNINVGEVMTERVLYCFEDQTLDEVAQNLGENQVRRLPVVNREKRLVGILSLCDLAHAHLNPKQLESTVNSITTQSHSKSNNEFMY